MPIGTSFLTASGVIGCDSSSRGITCADGNGNSFTIGDRYLIAQLLRLATLLRALKLTAVGLALFALIAVTGTAGAATTEPAKARRDEPAGARTGPGRLLAGRPGCDAGPL